MGESVIRLGIAGCGRVAWERHIPALKRVSQIRVEAVCDPDANRAAHIAGLAGAGKVYSSHEEMIERAGIDAVAVLTPTGSHAAVGVCAFKAGKHVFMEKPLALSEREAAELIQAEAESGRKAVMCFNLRWHRLIREAKRVIESGRLGRVKAVRSTYTHNRTGESAPDWHRKLESGGGVSFNEGVHHYDLWRYLLGAEIEHIEGHSISNAQYENETTVVSARLTGGVLASGVFSFLTGPNSELEVYGEKARMLVSLYRFDGLEIYPWDGYPGDTVDRIKRAASSMLKLPDLVGDARRGGSFQSTFEGVWRHFAQCVLDGTNPRCTLEDGRKAMEAALAFRNLITSRREAGGAC